MPSRPIAGKIIRLELENFKSYKCHQIIGPLYDFTAIIGPSGAGKSNLMDAISFVLGVRTGQLRGVQLRDLVYAFDDREKGEQSGRRRSHVMLVYQMPDGSEIEFTRSITTAAGGGSEYRIGDRIVNWEEYSAKLTSLNILVKARNFLVFQGDVESIACKNPKELTALVEKISGSEEYKRRYEELEVQKAEADQKAVLAHRKRKTISAERKHKKLQKEEAENHLKLQEQLKLLTQEHFLWQLSNIRKDIEKANEETDAEGNILKGVLDELDNYKAEAREKNREQAGYMKEIEKCRGRITEKQTRLGLDKYQSELVKLKDEISRIMPKMKSIDKEISKKKGDIVWKLRNLGMT
ncbi:hypothetical protein ACP275_13G100900 [Erythranthe tilingii]